MNRGSKLNVVVVSGDKDFQQLVQPGVWLLNPGRGGPAGVEEHWVGIENASERLGIPPDRVTDYLALVGDSSDNVPGVRGIGDKTACELVRQYGDLESILAHASEIPKKRPREALLEFAENARLSKELVTIRNDLPLSLDLEAMKLQEPDSNRLRELYVELEFHTLVKTIGAQPQEQKETAKKELAYRTVDTIEELQRVVTLASKAGRISLDTETLIDSDSPQKSDPLRSRLISIAIAVSPGKAYYFPLRHVLRRDVQSELHD